MNRVTRAVALLSLLAVAACELPTGRAEGGIPRERFVETTVALRGITATGENADTARQRVLEEHGVTEEELRAFVDARRDRPGELAAVWDEIRNRLIAVRDSVTDAQTAVSGADTVSTPADPVPAFGPFATPAGAGADTAAPVP